MSGLNNARSFLAFLSKSRRYPLMPYRPIFSLLIEYQGNVHYMFGLRYNGDFPAFVKDAKTQLALQADGKTEKELFVHYGETYEEVRIR